MRAIDREEAAAATRIPVLLTLLWGVLFTEVFALHAGGVPIALVGVKPCRHDVRVGYIWMLSTDAVTRHKRAVVETCAAYVAHCARRFSALGNVVDARNEVALRFVKRLGFTVCEPRIVGRQTVHPIVRLSCAA